MHTCVPSMREDALHFKGVQTTQNLTESLFLGPELKTTESYIAGYSRHQIPFVLTQDLFSVLLFALFLPLPSRVPIGQPSAAFYKVGLCLRENVSRAAICHLFLVSV